MNRGNRNWIWGAFFVVCAFLVLMSGLGIFRLAGFLWKIIFSIFIGLFFAESRRKHDVSGMIIAGVILFLIWKNTFGLRFISTGTIIVAAILLLIGMSFLNKPRSSHHNDPKNVYVNDSNDTILEIKEAFNSSSHYLRGSAVEKVYITPSFCSMSVYLDQIGFEENLDLIVDAGFCDLKIYIPKKWSLTNNIRAMFGQVVEEGVPLPVCEGNVTISGDGNFATIHIIRI